MTTPSFVPQDSSVLTAVRYHTAADPYHYTVDNRPLSDLDENIQFVATSGGDSARRAALFTQRSLSELFAQHFSSSNTNGVMDGLSISNVSPNTVTVQGGSVYISQALNASDARTVIKQFSLFSPVTFNVLSPTSSGQSIDYLIQGALTSLTTGNMAASSLPYLDSANNMLPCLLLNGDLRLAVKSGVAATTGSQVTPTADSGYIPLFKVTLAYGATVPTVVKAANSPDVVGLYSSAAMSLPVTSPAVLADVLGVATPTFADAAISKVNCFIPLPKANLIPVAPIQVKVTYSNTVASNNCAVNLEYAVVGSGGSVSGSVTSTTVEALPMSGTANTISTATLTATIPASAFATYSSGALTSSAAKLFVSVVRLGANALDTNTGTLCIHDVTFYQ